RVLLAGIAEIGRANDRLRSITLIHHQLSRPSGQSRLPRGYLVMGTVMMEEPSGSIELRRRIERGDESALVELFARHRDRLQRMVTLRLDRRLQGRIDASDVLQEAFLDVARRAREYLASPSMPPFLWLRWIAGQRLSTLHRRHLGCRMRDIGLEVSLH